MAHFTNVSRQLPARHQNKRSSQIFEAEGVLNQADHKKQCTYKNISSSSKINNPVPDSDFYELEMIKEGYLKGMYCTEMNGKQMVFQLSLQLKGIWDDVKNRLKVATEKDRALYQNGDFECNITLSAREESDGEDIDEDEENSVDEDEDVEDVDSNGNLKDFVVDGEDDDYETDETYEDDE